jgi:hypothetical protein
VFDTRRVYERIKPEIRSQFEQMGWMWVRNYHDQPRRRWQDVFQTDDRIRVQTYCEENRIECEWRPDNALRTRRVRPATLRHPSTREVVWFNHIVFFHVSTLSPELQSLVRSTYRDEDLPNNTYYGDGSPIDDATMTCLRDAYRLEMKSFPWQTGDILLIDNILTAHARNSFSGRREILLILADPVTRNDVP